eukprot:jgi/Hompol1/4417/HPOL_001738-RA
MNVFDGEPVLDDDLFEDPLAELGLKIRRGYENTAEIRKIRKEQRAIKAEMQERAKMNEMAILEPGQDKPSTSSQIHSTFIKTFPQLQSAEVYLANLRRRTRRTWIEKLSPDAIRRWISLSSYARAWMVFQVFITILAIINYVLLTYLVHSQDRGQRKLIKNLDLFYASVFLLDYSLSLYTAEDRLRFYINYMSLIDLLSIVSPFVFVLISSDTKFVWFVGLIRIFRATRILRTYRLLAFSQSEETRELTIFILNFMNFIFFSASVINATESLALQWNTPASLLNWHDSLYYIMVTFSTIGFGDLTPSSTISRTIVMFLVVLVIVYVPYQTGKILELYNSLSRYQRATHQASSEHPHVIVSGSITASGLVDFCREYFIADQLGAIVILHSQEPNLEIRRLLNHPFYRNRLIYLRGNLMSVPDLRRAAAQYSTGLFLLNTNTNSSSLSAAPVSFPPPTDMLDEATELKQARGMDAQILMQSLVAKSTFPGLPIFAQVQDIRSKELSTHCGCDRILCIDEIKMSLMASNCIVPGLQTLILNLIHSYKELETSSLSDFWMQEYQCGVANQIYTFKMPNGLVGMRFYDAVREVFSTYGTIMFALITSNAGFNENPVRMCLDPSYRIKNDDIAFCISDGGDETILRICLHFKDIYKKTELDQRDLERDMAKVLGEDGFDSVDDLRSSLSLANLMNGGQPHQGDGSNFEEVRDVIGNTMPKSTSGAKSKIGTVPDGIRNHIILCGNLTARAVRQFVISARGLQSSTESSNASTASGDNSSPVASGSKTLSASMGINVHVPIVCITEVLPAVDDMGIWADIFSHESVYIMQGTPIKKTSLIQAGVASCLRIVVLAHNVDAKSSLESLPDSQALFIVKMLQREWPWIRFLVELVDGSNVKYFSARNLEWDTNNLRMQSILSNYALSLGDRLALYRKIRSENAEQSTIWYQLVQLVFGSSSAQPGITGTRSDSTAVRPAARGRGITRSASRPPGQRSTSVSRRFGVRTYTSAGAIQKSVNQGDYDAIQPLSSQGDGADHADGEHHDRRSSEIPSANAQVETPSESSDSGDILPDNPDDDKKGQVTITEAYLQRLLEEAELNESGLSPYPVYHFDRHFAAGMVATSSFMHSLLCQSYFRPYIVDIVRCLIQNVVHLPVTNSCVGKPYIEIVSFYLALGFVPIGLYRRGAVVAESPKSAASATSKLASSTIGSKGGEPDAAMPYVYTNCRADDIVQANDLVFAIRRSDG